MRELLYTAGARHDIDDIFEYLTEQMGDVELARPIVDRIEAQCSKLAGLPGTLGRPRSELRTELRSFPFGNYIIFFRYAPRQLEIVNIIHSHRDLPELFGPMDQ